MKRESVIKVTLCRVTKKVSNLNFVERLKKCNGNFEKIETWKKNHKFARNTYRQGCSGGFRCKILEAASPVNFSSFPSPLDPLMGKNFSLKF